MRPCPIAHTPPQSPLRRHLAVRAVSHTRRGFSAVEIIAVATIIAILALLLIPMMRGRVEESRIKACKDEMLQISKCLDICYAENNHFYRLQDLDNTNRFKNSGTDNRGTDFPFGYLKYDRTIYTQTYVPYTTSTVPTLSSDDRMRYYGNWNGPYTSFHNFMKMKDLVVTWPNLVSGSPTTPIHYDPNTEGDDLYPLDPWGNPYIFFTQVYQTLDPLTGQSTSYSGRPVIFSMGPDGMPGTGLTAPPAANEYYPAVQYSPDETVTGTPPAAGRLGTGDDLVFKM